eukprot:gene38642-50750_t
MGRTLYDKIWDEHVVHTEEDGTAILYIDRHLVHEVTSPQAFEGIRQAGRKVWRVSSIVATADHNTPTTGWELGYDGITDPISKEQITTLDRNMAEFGSAAFFPFLSKRQGIVHVIGPETGATLPGMTVVCGDSHTSTHGAFGALAHGIGTSEVEHVMATQTLLAKKAKNMLITVEGQLAKGITGKDVVLAIGYGHMCSGIYKKFLANQNRRSHVWFRWFNEAPVLLLPTNSRTDAGSQKSVALPLALALTCLIVYASLYPFADWRDQGISPLTFLAAPWPQYLTGFDVAVNVLGYAPLGFLLALVFLRGGRTPWALSSALLAAVLVGAALSLCMETLQSYLPSRIPSNVDLALNTFGALLGAITASALEKLGVVGGWRRFRARWFAPDARGALALLLLWPVALLFPAPVPMGLGQMFERLETALADALADTPFIDWLPLRDIELQPLVPGIELVCVALGALIPCLLGYGVIRTTRQRALFSLVMLAVGVGASALSAVLSY